MEAWSPEKQPFREKHTVSTSRLGIPRRADTAELALEAVYWMMFVFFLLLPRPGSGGEESNTCMPTLPPNTYSMSRLDVTHLTRPLSKSSIFPCPCLNNSVLKSLNRAKPWGPKAECQCLTHG